jgi:hypothetical protein
VRTRWCVWPRRRPLWRTPLRMPPTLARAWTASRLRSRRLAPPPQPRWTLLSAPQTKPQPPRLQLQPPRLQLQPRRLRHVPPITLLSVFACMHPRVLTRAIPRMALAAAAW